MLKNVLIFLFFATCIVSEHTYGAPPVETLNDDNISRKISKGYSVIDFYAEWCSPCQKYAPIFKKVAEDLQDVAAFYKIDIDKSIESRILNRVTSIPTTILFHNGQEIGRMSSCLDEKTLKNFIRQRTKK